MNKTWIGYDGITYQTEKQKLKADLEYITKLQKQGIHPYYGMDGHIYLEEKDYLLANRIFLNEEPNSTLTR